MLTHKEIKEHNLIEDSEGNLELRNMLSVSPAFLEFMFNRGYFVSQIDGYNKDTITTTFSPIAFTSIAKLERELRALKGD